MQFFKMQRWSAAKPAVVPSAILIAVAIVCVAISPRLSAAPKATKPQTVIRADVSAAGGGEFTDDPANPSITITIPPGALTGDAVLRVRSLANPPPAGANQTAASRAFAVQLKARRRGRLQLMQPVKIGIAADPPPVHPEIGEIALRRGQRWERLPANFFRPSDSTVVALTQRLKGTFRVVHRALQRTDGPAVERGRLVFMQETFGNEDFFGGVLGLHALLNQVAPVDAVALGAQVDVTRVPQAIVDVMTGDDLAAKDAALADPATTRALIKAGAVIGVRGVYATDEPDDDVMIATGLTCALCHVNVTPIEFELSGGPTALPIGVPRFDGVPNAAMDAGAILAFTPFAQSAGPEVVDLLNSWGAGHFDIRALPDNPLEDLANNPTAYPPIWNFVDLERQGYRFGWDGLFANDGTNNNALASQAEAVYDLVMHANGAFGNANGTLPPELSVAPPQALLDALIQAELDAPGNDIPAQPLLDLQTWMRSIVSPPPGSFDEALAEVGFELFHGRGGCAACHTTAEFTGPGNFLDITAEPPAGSLDVAGGIRVPGLRGIAHTAPFFHDGSAGDLAAAVARYVARGQGVPALDAAEQAALVEYLKSL